MEIACGVIEKGTVGGYLREWTAWTGGAPKIAFQSDRRAVAARFVYSVCGKYPSCDADPGSMGRVFTAMNAVNSIPQIVRTTPGVVTHLDLLGYKNI